MNRKSNLIYYYLSKLWHLHGRIQPWSITSNAGRLGELPSQGRRIRILECSCRWCQLWPDYNISNQVANGEFFMWLRCHPNFITRSCWLMWWVLNTFFNLFVGISLNSKSVNYILWCVISASYVSLIKIASSYSSRVEASPSSRLHCQVYSHRSLKKLSLLRELSRLM